MSPKRIGTLLGKELLRGPKNFLFIFAIVVPVVLTVVISLAFGTWFTGKPVLGITDAGSSQIPNLAEDISALVLKEYETVEDLQQAATDGTIDIGISLPAEFDERVAQGEETELAAYIWGESLLKDRALLASAFLNMVRDVADQDPPVEIVMTTLGNTESIPWQDRLMPFMVLMTVLIGGMMVPATSLVDEKQKKTLRALIITPASLGEVYVAKGMLGVILSFLVGILLLVMNQVLLTEPLLILMVLLLGAVVAAEFGVLLGAYVKDIDTLFATIKGLGIFLYAPALIYLFPGIPQWIGKIFPTYYIVGPIIKLTQEGGTWGDIALEVFILCGIIVALMGGIGLASKRLSQLEA